MNVFGKGKRYTRIALLIFMIGGLNSCAFLGPSTRSIRIDGFKNGPYDVIIIPGMPYDSFAFDGKSALKARVYWSKFLFDKGVAKNIIYSGSAVYTPFYESKIMGMYAEQLGIPSEHIFYENQAEHSTENIYYGYYLAKKLGFEKIAVATDPFQARL